VSFSNTKQWSARSGFDLPGIRRKCPRPESPSGCVLGPGAPSNPVEIASFVETSNVAGEFAGGRNAEFAEGTRTSVQPSNVAAGGYNRGIYPLDIDSMQFPVLDVVSIVKTEKECQLQVVIFS